MKVHLDHYIYLTALKLNYDSQCPVYSREITDNMRKSHPLISAARRLQRMPPSLKLAGRQCHM